MQEARYGAVFFEPESFTESLLMLVRDMNRHTRCVALPLGPPGNSAGAQQVLSWQTGYPTAVDFAAGYPQYDLERNSANNMLSAGSVDVALVVACDPIAEPLVALSETALAHLATIPSIVLHTADSEPAANPAVAIAVASPGIHAGGTVFRSDGVALPLRTVVNSPHPLAETVLLALEERIEQTPAVESRG
jgi:formylmethanofuran dehydrogenase subunit B